MRENKKRFIYMFVLGMLIAFLLNKFLPGVPNDHNVFFDYLQSLLITFLVWEGNLRLDNWLNQVFPWIDKPGKRLLIQFVLSMLFSSLATYLPMRLFNHYVCIIPEARSGMLTDVALIAGLGVSIILLFVEISTQFFKNWKKSLIEVEHYKTQSVQAQLQNLKNQVNPHFLFNNLSVLSSLVYKDQDKAVDFINQLSKVYRYLLEVRNAQLVMLEEEMVFIRSYIYLIQIRFDTNIKFEINLNESDNKKLIPPLALQMLIENAIKHNEISAEFPLKVVIRTENNKLVVENNIKLRANKEESTNSGLSNIKERYKFYTDEVVEIYQDNQLFKVAIPLLLKL